MGNPFALPTELPAHDRITGPQRSFLLTLAKEKYELLGENLIEKMPAAEEFADKLSKWDASNHIDRLKTELRELRAAAKAAKIADAVDLEGYWELPDGRIVKVQRAVVMGNGEPYGKVLNTETGKFNWSPGILGEVKAHGTRLGLDRAKQLGQLYGICMICGRTLTDENSIANGIGPICATKF